MQNKNGIVCGLLRVNTSVMVPALCCPFLQRASFAHFPELQDFALANVAAVDTRESLTKQFGHLR